jgi:hypothetical protein
MARVPHIAGWECVGQFVAGLPGLAWSITRLFAIPVLVAKKSGLMVAVKRSATIMKSTSRESLELTSGIGLISFFGSPAGALFIVAGGLVIQTTVVVEGALLAAGALLILFVPLIPSALSSILLAARCMGAVKGRMPLIFDARMIQKAFGNRLVRQGPLGCRAQKWLFPVTRCAVGQALPIWRL